MTQIYNDPAGGSASSIGSQIRTDFYNKKAIVEAVKESYFGQLADVTAMPKHMGKTIKKFQYLPILDDRNINDQGIDAAGNVGAADTNGMVVKYVLKVTRPEHNGLDAVYDSVNYYFTGQEAIDTGTAAIDTHAEVLARVQAVAEKKAMSFLWNEGYADVATPSNSDTYAKVKVLAEADNWVFTVVDDGADQHFGNLYGSAKDVGYIQGKIPALSETGGRVNRVGMKRIELEGSIEKFGFFEEYTQESMDFDSDEDRMTHLTTEVVKGANEITEDQIQIDLLNGAGVVRYTGSATATSELQGNDVSDPFDAGNTNDLVAYDDLVKLGIELDNNRTPKQTKIIAGSRMTDTQVVNAARYMYIGSELQTSIMRMTDYHGNKAFIPVAKYASAGNVARGEFGAIDTFRFIIVPEMMHWSAAGADVTLSAAESTVFRNSAAVDGTLKYDVFPMLVVGQGSFTTIGFQTDGKTVKFKTYHKAPGENVRPEDPYGEVGFMSIKWYYGLMILRPERIGLIKTIAEW